MTPANLQQFPWQRGPPSCSGICPNLEQLKVQKLASIIVQFLSPLFCRCLSLVGSQCQGRGGGGPIATELTELASFGHAIKTCSCRRVTADSSFQIKERSSPATFCISAEEGDHALECDMTMNWSVTATPKAHHPDIHKLFVILPEL